jgi:transcriptional regulator with XRE-family HTH domain
MVSNEMNFGEFLRVKRKAKGMSIRQLAMYAGVSNSYLSILERGVLGSRGPTPGFLRKLVRTLGVPYEVLMVAAGYQVLAEDEKLYTGVLVKMIRDAHGDSVEEFARRVGLYPYEIHELEERGVFFETLESIYRKLHEHQQKLTGDQKIFLHRVEIAIRGMPTESYKKVEKALSSVLALVESHSSNL